MIHVDLEERKKRHNFMLEAATVFKEHPEIYTYTEGEIVPGCLFAVRWGLARTSVVVFKLDDSSPIENYMSVIPVE